MNRREVGCIIVMGAVWFVAGLIQALGISLDNLYERVRKKDTGSNAAIRQAMIDNLVAEADGEHRGWVREFYEENLDEIIGDVLRGNVLKHGFRGREVRDELRRRGFAV